MATLDETPILDLGRNPIPGGDPCGVDAAEEEEYLLVGAEMSKVDRIESDEPDWYQIEGNATAVLRGKSKDVEVAASLGHALFKLYSYAGLSATLGLLTELVRNFWDGSFPQRPRRRKARIEALANRFTEQAWFRDNQPKADDFDALDVCVTRADELEAALKEKMPDEPPDFRKFKQGLKELAAKRPKPAAQPATAPPAGAAAPAGGPPAAGATFAPGEIADPSSALNAVLQACTFLRKADPTDPIPYAVTRVLKWSKVSLPTSDAGKYQIEPPEASALDALTHQHANGLWEHLLKGAEAAFRSNDPLWLDLQRYVCAAMAGLGPPYQKAREAVMGQTAALVLRLGEGLYELRFRNGTPLCSGETKMWIESDVAPAKGDGGGPAVGARDGRLAEASQKARKLAGSGKLKEAVQELADGLKACTQQRDRFLWRLLIAQLCFEGQRLGLAASLLEESREEILRHRIDEWEPSLAVAVAQTLYRCRKSLTMSQKAPPPEALQGVRDSYAWLCQLDPLAALAAEPSGQ
jgi:type VI secretion system protein VasJ